MKLLIIVALVCLSGLLSNPVWAQEVEEDQRINHAWMTDSFIVSIGGFLPRKTIELSARGSASENDFVIDFNEYFKGGEKENVAALNFHWRFAKKWWVSAEYYGTDFREGATLEEDVEWNGNVFPAGSYANAGTNMDIYRLVLGRKVYSTNHSELGLGLGIHWMELGAFIEGELLIGEETSGIRTESVSASAPLPNLTLWYLHSFSAKWALVGRFDWLSASYDEYSGTIRNYNLGINYQAFEHFGVGLTYKQFELDVDVEKSDWFGTVRLKHKGPFISFTANW